MRWVGKRGRQIPTAWRAGIFWLAGAGFSGWSVQPANPVSASQSIPAVMILDELLAGYANEMMDHENSFSFAICEFYSDPEISKEDNSITKQYEISKAAWAELIHYGISTKEFNQVNPEAVFHIIVFAYQGVRMYSKLMKMDNDIPSQIINEMKRLLLP